MQARKRTQSQIAPSAEVDGHPPGPSKRPRIEPQHARQPMRESTNTGNRDTLSLQKELKVVKEQLNAAKEQLNAAKEQLDAAKARAEKYKSRYKDAVAKQLQTNKAAPDDRTEKKIPKPHSNSQRIQHHMLLDENDAQYLAIRDTVIQVLYQSKADLMTSWAAQSQELKAKVIKMARRREPYLNRFEGDWATQALTAQYLRNHIGYNRRKHDPTSSYNVKRNDRIQRRGNHRRGRATTPSEGDNESVISRSSKLSSAKEEEENEGVLCHLGLTCKKEEDDPY